LLIIAQHIPSTVLKAEALWSAGGVKMVYWSRIGDVQAVELDLADAPYPDLKRALAYWTVKRQEHFAPVKKAMDPIDLVEVLPRIMLIDVELDPLDFRYRLAGTGICDTHRTEPTGTRPRDLEPQSYGRLIHRHYCEAVESRTPILHLIVLDTFDRSRAYARLLLPLSDDGLRVTGLMTIDAKEQNTRALREYFEYLKRRTQLEEIGPVVVS
jgi:hypothetical protein